MLILKRKPGEAIRIGENVTVSILSVDSGQVRVAIDAPVDIPILRSELLETIAANQESVVVNTSADEVLALLDGVFPPPSSKERKES